MYAKPYAENESFAIWRLTYQGGQTDICLHKTEDRWTAVALYGNGLVTREPGEDEDEYQGRIVDFVRDRGLTLGDGEPAAPENGPSPGM